MAEQKSNIEIINEIRDSRNRKLKEIGRNDIFVTKVEALGVGEKTNKRFFRLIEEKELFDSETNETKKEIWEWFYEYENKLNLIGVRNPNTIEYDDIGIVPVEFNDNEKELWSNERDDIVKCIEEREAELEAIAKELGISQDEINSLSEIDLSQKIAKRELKDDKEKNENENEKKQLSQEEVKKAGMTGMNEVNLNSKIDDKGTELRDALNLDGYTKLLVVHSYKLLEVTDANGEKGKNSVNEFSFIAQKADGTFETLPKDKLVRDGGANSEIIECKNKDNVEVRNEDCRFSVPGTNKSLIINQNGPYGIPNVYLSQNTRDNDGQLAQKLQDKYDGTERTDIEVRALFNNNRGLEQARNSVEEARKHKRAGCDEIDIDEADGNENTGHVHFDPEDTEQQNAIQEIMQRAKISEGEAKKLFDKYLNDKGNHGEGKDIIKNAIENSVKENEDLYRGGDSRKQ